MPPSIGARIQSDIEDKILSGAWPPGSRIPYEHELMAQYECSRMTVSKVLGTMSARGLIVRRKRAGSFVASPATERSILKIEDFADMAARAGQTYLHRVLHRQDRTASRQERVTLDLPVASRVLDIQTLHLLDRVPVALEERLVMLGTVPDAAAEAFDQAPPGSWLLRHVPWTEAEHVISALNATTSLSQTLAIGRGEACLKLHRRTWLQGALVTDVRLTYPASRYSFSGRFSPGGSRAD